MAQKTNLISITLEDLEILIQNNRYFAFKIYDCNNKLLFPYENAREDLEADEVKEELSRIIDTYENIYKFRVSLPTYKHEEFLQLTSAERRISYNNAVRYLLEFEGPKEEPEPIETIQEPAIPMNGDNFNVFAFMQMQQTQFNLMLKKEAEYNRRQLEQQKENFNTQLEFMQMLHDRDNEESDEAINGINEANIQKLELTNTIIEKVTDIAAVVIGNFKPKTGKVDTPSKADELLKRWQQIDPDALERFEQTIQGIESNPQKYKNDIQQATTQQENEEYEDEHDAGEY